MLSIAKVSTGATGAGYYQGANDYYCKDQQPTRWHGQGAERLGLSGSVDAGAFRNLLDGRMPDGSQIHNAAEGRRGGTDLTFSAPKSVSMQSLIGGDTRLIEAHDRAVVKALGYVQGLAACRVTENSETRFKKTGNLIVASFRHDLSRAADPNLHTHSVVINATQRADGQWRALEQTEIYRQQKLIGALYRSELALEVQRLGYEIRATHADGRFELAHINNRQVEAFSQRSAAIEAALATQGKTRETATAREKEVATLATRSAKGEIDRAALLQSWREKSSVLGIDFAPTQVQPLYLPEARAEGAREAVNYAVAHTTERQSIVSETQLLQAALQHGTGQTDLEAIRAEIDQQRRERYLLGDGAHFTTHAARGRERQLLAIEMRGRDAVAPLMSSDAAKAALEGRGLNAGQQAAATLVVTSESRIAAIQGAAGTGKTTMLREASGLAESSGYQMRGIAPSAAAARELQKAGIEGTTIAAFLASERAGLNDKTILVVDEAGMVSAKDMLAVLEKTEQSGARAVLVGDVQQLKAVEAGKPFAQLQEAGMVRVEMGEIMRQNDAQLRRAVEYAAVGDTVRSLVTLQHHVVEIERYADRHLAIAKEYAELNAQDRSGTLILAGTHSARTAINELVRAELGLSGQGMTVSTLERKDMTEVQSRMSASYQVGDVIEAQRNYPSLGLERGDQAQVVESAPGRITLERLDGVQVEWRPTQQTYMTAYRSAERELSVGDLVRFNANDHARGVINGETGTVTSIDAERQTVSIEKSDGNVLTLNTSRPLHLDHGYCSTVHSSQGQTTDRVLIDADTRSLTANESSFYVGISRAREEVTIYTDDREMLPEAVSREDSKSAALELVPEALPEKSAAAELSL